MPTTLKKEDDEDNTKDKTPKSAVPRITEEELLRFPWLARFQHIDTDTAPKRRRGGGHGGHGGHGGEPITIKKEEPIVIDSDEEPHMTREEILERLAEERVDDAVDMADVKDFGFRTNGGLWTMENLHKVADGTQGFCRNKLANSWASHFKMPKEPAFGFGPFGRHGAHIMAVQWCKKTQHFFNLFWNSEEDEYVYSEQDLGSFVEDEEWINWACSLDPASHAFDRMVWLRHLRPTNPE